MLEFLKDVEGLRQTLYNDLDAKMNAAVSTGRKKTLYEESGKLPVNIFLATARAHAYSETWGLLWLS